MATGFSLLVWTGGRCDAVAWDENIIASMFGTTLTFRDVCCKSADKSLGLSRSCVGSCWSSCAWFSPSHLAPQIWSLHTLPPPGQLANYTWRHWPLATVDWWFLCVFSCQKMIQKMQKKLLHQPLHPNGLPTGMHVQRFLRVSSLFEPTARQKRSNSATLRPFTGQRQRRNNFVNRSCIMESWVQRADGIVSKVLRLARKSEANPYEVLNLSRGIMSPNLTIWCSKTQFFAGNQRPDFLTSLMAGFKTANEIYALTTYTQGKSKDI